MAMVMKLDKLKIVQTLSLRCLHYLFNNTNREVPWSTWKSFFVSWLCMSSPIVISEHQTSPRWRWIMLSGNNTLLSLPYCILTLTLNTLQAWVTEATQYTITTPILCGFTLSKDSFWVTLSTKCLSNLLFFFKRIVAVTLMKPTEISQQNFNQVYMQGS